MLALQHSQTILVLMLLSDGVLGGILIGNDALKMPITAKKSLPDEEPHSIQRRQAQVNTVNVCFDCDQPCVNAIATTTYTPSTYFAAIVNQLNAIYANSQLPLVAKLQGVYELQQDFVLDPYKNFTLDKGMGLYYKGARIAERLLNNCHVSFLITEDSIFGKDNIPSGMAYMNSVCTTWGYGISRYTSDISAQSARVAHELSHTMNINHVSDGQMEAAYKQYPAVIAFCNPDYCPDPTGQCITQAILSRPAPTYYSLCGRAAFFAWRHFGGGLNCLSGPNVTFYNFRVSSGSG